MGLSLFKRKARRLENDLDTTLLLDSTCSSDPCDRQSLTAREILPLLKSCIQHIKLGGLLDSFLFLPFRQVSVNSSVKNFINSYLRKDVDDAMLQKELLITEQSVLIGVVHWLCSRLKGGLLSRDQYLLFLKTENDLNFAEDAFGSIMNILFDTNAEKCVLLQFLDLLVAIAAHEASNGHDLEPLAMSASVYVFPDEPSQCQGNGFDRSHDTWVRDAHATIHLLLAFLRDMSFKSVSGMPTVPRTLQNRILAEHYPPKASVKSGSTHPVIKIKFLVETISDSPFVLLQKAANHCQTRDFLGAFANPTSNPSTILTEDCYRVLSSIEAVTIQHVNKIATSPILAEWSDFNTFGFVNHLKIPSSTPSLSTCVSSSSESPSSQNNRPETQDWADFMLSGFAKPLTVPTILPMQYHLPLIEAPPAPPLFPGATLQSVACEIERGDIHEAFWDAWLLSVARECPDAVQSRFGNTLIVKLQSQDEWIILEEVMRAPTIKPTLKHSKSLKLFPKRDKHVEAKATQAGVRRSPRYKDTMFPSCREAERKARALVQAKLTKDKPITSASNGRRVKKRSVRLSENYLLQTGELAAAMAYISAYDRRPSIFSSSTSDLISDLTHDCSGQSNVASEPSQGRSNLSAAATDRSIGARVAFCSGKAQDTMTKDENLQSLTGLLVKKHSSLETSQGVRPAPSIQSDKDLMSHQSLTAEATNAGPIRQDDTKALVDIVAHSSGGSSEVQGDEPRRSNGRRELDMHSPKSSRPGSHNGDAAKRPSLFVEQFASDTKLRTVGLYQETRPVSQAVDRAISERPEDGGKLASMSGNIGRRWLQFRGMAKVPAAVKSSSTDKRDNLL